MSVTYSRLWHLLLDRKMKKKDLQQQANLTAYVMNCLSNDKPVTTETLAKICKCLNCSFDDIMELVE